MKTLKHINIIALAFLMLGMHGCKSALDKLPLDAPSDETFFSNETELNLALNGAYRMLYWDTGAEDNTWYPAVLDNATDIGYLRTPFDGVQTYSFGAHTTETSAFSASWQTLYKGIGRCNNILTYMVRAKDAVPEAYYGQVEAQALFLRAFYYSWLIQLYGDVPFISEAVDASNIEEAINKAKVPRAPRAEIADRLLADLEYASELLPASWSGVDVGRATKGAALTLRARIALYEGRHEVAANTAKQVMDLATYHLHGNYEELFTYAGVRNAEVIFDLPYQIGFLTSRRLLQQGPRSYNCWSTMVPSQFMIDSYECTDGLPIDKSPNYDPSNPFENRDPRLDASIIRPQSVYGGYVFETHPDSTQTTRYVDGVATRVANQDALNAFATFTGYLWRKYTSEEDLGDRYQSELNTILIRYAEVLLIYAESKIELGQIDATVLDAINQVRARAYGADVGAVEDYPAITTTDQAALRTIIRRERKVELANEGFRMTDIRRWKIAEYLMPGTLVGRPKSGYADMVNIPEIDVNGHPHYGSSIDLYRSVDQRVFNVSKDYLWPIPQKDMDVNDALEQNPGY